MPIIQKDQLINLETEHTLYQMKIDDHGILMHLWYGEKTGTDMEYLRSGADVGFSGNPYDMGKDRTRSLDILPQEYPALGTGDYRVKALAVKDQKGCFGMDLRFREMKVSEGKYAIPGLPAVYLEEGQKGETLEILLKDPVSDLQVVLKYGVIDELDVITRSSIVINGGIEPVYLEKAASLSMDLPYRDWEWIHFHGRHTAERIPERRKLFHGIQQSSSTRGSSSHQQNPTVILCEEDCREDAGSCIGAALMYSGGFQTQIELDQWNQIRLVMGIDTEEFRWKLDPGEAFYTPEVILSYSGQGFAGLSHNFHRVIRNNVCRGKYKNIQRPVLINNWEATYFDFNKEKLVDIARTASSLGIDMLVMDDGWFGKRDNDYSGLGDWFVNEEKLQSSLEELVKEVNAFGMDFGIWFEPEMVSEDSRLYRDHPEWVIRIPGKDPVRSRYQLVLDLTREDVREYLYRCMAGIITQANIRYIKWDMNRSISDWHSEMLEPEHMGEMRHRYVLGLYQLLERLTTDFPQVLLEGCSGGGGRFDAGMLYYCPQIWCSDDTDAYERTGIQYGTSFFYPVSTMGAHVSAVPNHQTGRVTPFETRGLTAMAGTFGYELNVNYLTDEEREEIQKQVKYFKENWKIFHQGRYYRLSNPLEDPYMLWEYVYEDTVIVHGMVGRTKPNAERFLVKLQGLDEKARYHVEGRGDYSGTALMKGGILLDQTGGDYIPVNIQMKRR